MTIIPEKQWRAAMADKSISIVKESRDGDLRVIALPGEVASFVSHGYAVYVETGAGDGQHVSDDDYRAAGAKVVDTDDAWTASDIVFKCRCPSEPEYRYFRPGLHLSSTFYLGDKPELAAELNSRRVSAYSYEMFEDDDGSFPLMTSDSEISGHMAVIYAAYHLQDQLGGSGTMFGRLPGIKAPRVLVIGHGNAGGAAARAAAALGADVTVVGTSRMRLRRFAATMPPNVTCELGSPGFLAGLVPQCDVIIGAIRVSNHGTEPIVTDDMVASMRPGSVIVDVTCGYGPGYLPTADRRTRELTEAYKHHGVIHIKNDCMPKLVYLTATAAMSQTAFPYLLALAESVHTGAPDRTSERGQVTRNGVVVHPHIQRELALRDGALR
jgi:alanine dehydrogenase